MACECCEPKKVPKVKLEVEFKLGCPEHKTTHRFYDLDAGVELTQITNAVWHGFADAKILWVWDAGMRDYRKVKL